MHSYIRWETLPGDNRDAPKTDASGNTISPTPSLIRVYRTQAEFSNSLMSTGGTFYGRMFKPISANLFGAMRRTGDSTLPFEASLLRASAGTADFAQWSFNLDTAGDYAVGSSAFTNAASGDSFWVLVDNGQLIDWRVSGRWAYQPVTSGGNGMVRFDLAAGNHTLRLYAQEAYAKLAYLWMKRPGTAKSPSLQLLSYSGFMLAADPESVSGYSFKSATGSNTPASKVHYQITVSQTGNNLLLGRTRVLNETSDSFYLSINKGASKV
jgi:hypothetical protein